MGEIIQTVGPLAGVCGHDGTNWEKILIDASKRLVVAIDAFSATLEVTQDTPADLLVGTHHYDGTTWRKASLGWGYYDIVSEAVSDTNLPAGASALSGPAVPAGEVWVISCVGAYVNSATITSILLQTIVDSVGVPLLYQTAPVSFQWYVQTGQFILKEGDTVRVYISGATLGDDAYLRYGGYKMKVNL